jgi:hypothetical protein
MGLRFQILLDKVCERTSKYLGEVNKAERKVLGQFFASIETAKVYEVHLWE